MFVVYQAFTVPPDGEGENVTKERAIWGWAETSSLAVANAVQNLEAEKDSRAAGLTGLKLSTGSGDEVNFLHGAFVLRKCTARLAEAVVRSDGDNEIEKQIKITNGGEADIEN